jgi:hypothetical protein
MEAEMKALKTVQVTMENGYSYKTSVNGNCTDKSIKDYFVGKYFNFGMADGPDVMLKCTKIQIMED